MFILHIQFEGALLQLDFLWFVGRCVFRLNLGWACAVNFHVLSEQRQLAVFHLVALFHDGVQLVDDAAAAHLVHR